MSKNIVFEGWLTKSPPSKRIWRTKWRRRWFALRQSGELPGQYFLDYYADRNYRRLKGTINLDLCEQVDAGLHMERNRNCALDPKLRGSVFTIQTQSRIYHLEADCETDMEKWVDAICRVCGLRATDEGPYQTHSTDSNVNTFLGPYEQNDYADTTGPYIPISECITGIRAQGSKTAFTFDPDNIVTSTRHRHMETFNPPKMPMMPITMIKPTLERVAEQRENENQLQTPLSPPFIHESDNESNSDEECASLNIPRSNIRECAVAKSFTKLTISPPKDGISENDDIGTGPPVPPRPPKTFAMSKDLYLKDTTFQGPKIQEPPDTQEPSSSAQRIGRRMSQSGCPPSPTRTHLTPKVVVKTHDDDDDDDVSPNNQSLIYCNLPSLPPAVDRNLKPRPASHISSISGSHAVSVTSRYEARSETLQYLDLDLEPKSSPTMMQGGRKVDIIHGKSNSADSAYKTVDFLKTEAFNITRQDAEASRNVQY